MASAYAPARDDLQQSALARQRLLEQVYGDDPLGSAIAHGFVCNGEKVLLANHAVGIFKPKQMRRGALSLKPLRPQAGHQNVDADAEDADGTFVYSLQGDDPDNHYNRSLRCACRTGSPSSISTSSPEASTRPSFPASSRAST